MISKEDRKELGTAIGLFASGVGAGSYVYLRRILERLVYQAKETAANVIAVSYTHLDVYKRQRFQCVLLLSKIVIYRKKDAIYVWWTSVEEWKFNAKKHWKQ